MYRLVLLLLVVALTTARNIDNRILGGKVVTIEEYPHQVSFKNVMGGHFCGGAIINRQFVVTSAHCTARKNKNAIHFRVGSSHLSGGVTHKIKKITPHPKFYLASLDCDVAVVQALEPIQFGTAVQPVSIVLPKDKPYVGEMLQVSGWGMNEYTRAAPSRDLRAVKVPLVERTICAFIYQSKNTVVSERMICAGGGKDTGTYKGDSGGPLINEKKQLVGIVSWGLTINITGYPGIYTDVAHPTIRPFIINETIAKWNNLDDFDI